MRIENFSILIVEENKYILEMFLFPNALIKWIDREEYKNRKERKE